MFKQDIIELVVSDKCAYMVWEESFISQIFICSYYILSTHFTVLLSNVLGSEGIDINSEVFE